MIATEWQARRLEAFRSGTELRGVLRWSAEMDRGPCEVGYGGLVPKLTLAILVPMFVLPVYVNYVKPQATAAFTARWRRLCSRRPGLSFAGHT